MSSIPIHSAFDISTARNILRKQVAGPKWTPVFRARAATAVTALGELILSTQHSGHLEAAIIMGHGTWGLELKCSFDESGQAIDEKLRRQLKPAVDDMQTSNNGRHVNVVAHVWLT